MLFHGISWYFNVFHMMDGLQIQSLQVYQSFGPKQLNQHWEANPTAPVSRGCRTWLLLLTLAVKFRFWLLWLPSGNLT